MNKPENYFYEQLEKEYHVPTDEDIDKYVDDNFKELFDALIRRFVKVIIEQKYKGKNE